MDFLEEFGAPEVQVSEADYVEKIKKINPFDFINSISYSKQDLMVDDTKEREYNPYIVNRGLGFGSDTAIWANEMNSRPHIDNKMQYDFLRHTVRKGKRYNKWMKSEEENLEIIQEFFGYSFPKAKEALRILTPDQLDIIKHYLKTCKGGKL
jgi:hypothetical protein